MAKNSMQNILDYNIDRIGKTMLNYRGSEIKDSIMLSSSVYAVLNSSGHIQIMDINRMFDAIAPMIPITCEMFIVLKSFKITP